MSDIRRWSAAKCERIQDKLDSTVAGPNRDPEMLLDILIAAWEEMHREAKQAQGSVSALRAAADAEAEAGDEARREATRLRAENTRLRDALREARAFLDTRHGSDGKLRRPANLARIDAAVSVFDTPLIDGKVAAPDA